MYYGKLIGIDPPPTPLSIHQPHGRVAHTKNRPRDAVLAKHII
jgi:hypothetical protein